MQSTNPVLNTKKPGGWKRWLLFLMLLPYTLLGWLRMGVALRQWHYLVKLGVWPRPLYFVLSGGLIGLVFTIACLVLLIRKPFEIIAVRAAGWLFLAWFWVDRIWLGTRESFYTQLAVAILITVFTLGWLLILAPRSVKKIKEVEIGPQTGTGS